MWTAEGRAGRGDRVDRVGPLRDGDLGVIVSATPNVAEPDRVRGIEMAVLRNMWRGR